LRNKHFLIFKIYHFLAANYSCLTKNMEYNYFLYLYMYKAQKYTFNFIY
jgi:hypothetical protein